MSSKKKEKTIKTYVINAFPIYEVSEDFQFKSIEEKKIEENNIKDKGEIIEFEKYLQQEFPIVHLSNQIKKLNCKEAYESFGNTFMQKGKSIPCFVYNNNGNKYYDINEHTSFNDFHIINQSE